MGSVRCFVSTTGPGRKFRRLALTALLVLGAAANPAAQPLVQQVLVLQSFDRGSLPVDHFTGNFRVDLDQRAERPVNVVEVVVGPTGFVGAPEQAVVDYIRSTYADRPKPELIVTVAGPAAVFARKHRQELFPDTPLLVASVDERLTIGRTVVDAHRGTVDAHNNPERSGATFTVSRSEVPTILSGSPSAA